MANFQITPEGQILSVSADGTLTPLGSIDAQGNFSWPDGAQALRPNAAEALVRSIARPELKEFVEMVIVAAANPVPPELAGGFQIVKGARPATITGDEHEWVDLGLPSGLKWATCNVGASKPEEAGDFFAWGETEPKEDYGELNYKYGIWRGPKSRFFGVKYVDDSDYGVYDGKSMLGPEDDAATVNWGSNWRTPTMEELEELKRNCVWKIKKLNGVTVFKVSSKTNRSSLILPLVGSFYGTEKEEYPVGEYWSSSIYPNEPNIALCMSLSEHCKSSEYTDRYCGLSVRPVLK